MTLQDQLRNPSPLGDRSDHELMTRAAARIDELEMFDSRRAPMQPMGCAWITAAGVFAVVMLVIFFSWRAGVFS